MDRVIARGYLSPTLVLLAMDWSEGEQHKDFLGFAINRTPDFRHPKTRKQDKWCWLPNRIGFSGPPANNKPGLPQTILPYRNFSGEIRKLGLKYYIVLLLSTWGIHRKGCREDGRRVPLLYYRSFHRVQGRRDQLLFRDTRGGTLL